jgi:ubiquinone/menaquinone biosynthesis C-methylase UbiE
MSRYYAGRQARRYNTRLRAFTHRTHTEALALIDFEALRCVGEQEGRAPRVLDVACGTGLFLNQILERAPAIEAYGIDGSADMLEQARTALSSHPRTRLERLVVGVDGTATLPFAPATFDLITCTNALHAIPSPLAALSEWKRLLTPAGHIVVEDFARREPPFPWAAFEWLVRRVVGESAHVLTLPEVKALCLAAGLQVAAEKAFSIDWLLRGWVLRATQGRETPAA